MKFQDTEQKEDPLNFQRGGKKNYRFSFKKPKARIDLDFLIVTLEVKRK